MVRDETPCWRLSVLSLLQRVCAGCPGLRCIASCVRLRKVACLLQLFGFLQSVAFVASERLTPVGSSSSLREVAKVSVVA